MWAQRFQSRERDMETRLQAVGMIEFNSIAVGIEAADTMVKAALVEPLMMKTICPGKYLVGVYSEVASVQAAVGAGLQCGKDAVVDHFVIPNINPPVVSGMSGAVELTAGPAVGVIETFSVASSIVAADVASKAANVDIIDLRIAMGLGGKAFCLLAGDVASVETAVASGAESVAANGMLVRKVVIPSISPQVLKNLA
jgi:microcompartment protein CcmL/EutN